MICIVQARMSSKRFPGKTMKSLVKKTLLQRVLNRIEFSKKIDKIIVATSTSKKDDQIEKFCIKNNYAIYRSNLNNVVKRFEGTINKFNIKDFIRISADSPLLDPKIIDHAINIYKKRKVDIVTNVFPRTFPKGQSVEIINSNIFLKFSKKITNKEYKEHITKYFYQNHKKFKIVNFTSKTKIKDINLSIDTKKDFQNIEKIIKYMNDKNISLKNIIKIRKKIDLQ